MRVINPLISGETYRQWVHLLLGGAILVPYALVLMVMVSPFLGNTEETTTADLVGFGAMALLAAVPALMIMLIPATSVLGVAAAKTLLGVAVPDMTMERARGWRTRRRAAAWFVLNIVVGGVVSTATVLMPMLAIRLFSAPFFNLSDEGARDSLERTVGEQQGWGPPAAYLAGVVLLVGLVYGVAAVGKVLSRVAPALLGPSPADRLADLERQAEQLVERNRLARELHDSVGHALTVTTLQAAAAGQVLDSDPEFARRALVAIEEAGRTALEDLDNVLGLLREGTTTKAPQRTLDDLPDLLDKTRSTGLTVRADLTGAIDELPPVVSREAYRIVQEGLTNALRHAGKVPITVRLVAGGDGLDVEMSNPMPDGAVKTRVNGGRGLRGIRERVTILGGKMTAGADHETWRVEVRLPLRRTSR